MNILEKLANRLLNYAQMKLNEDFEKNELTDGNLKIQLKINALRNKSNLTNEKELNERGYLQ